MKQKIVARCPYCKKAIGLDLTVSGVNVKESKVDQKTYAFESSLKEGCKWDNLCEDCEKNGETIHPPKGSLKEGCK